MQVAESRKLKVHFRYLRILTKKLLREDKYILPMYLLTVLFVTSVVALFTVLDQFHIFKNDNGKFVVGLIMCVFMFSDSAFWKIGLRHVSSKLGLKLWTEPLEPEYERIAAHIRSVLAENKRHQIPARYALTSSYIVLEILGRAVSRLLQTLENPPSMSVSIRGLLLRR